MRKFIVITILAFVSLISYSQEKSSVELRNYFVGKSVFIESKKYHTDPEECTGKFEFYENSLNYSYCEKHIKCEWKIYSDSYDIILEVKCFEGNINEKFQVKVLEDSGKKIIRLFKLTSLQSGFKREYYLE